MITLYYAPTSVALASHIALEEAGAPYDTVRLDLKAGAQRSAEYLAINPKGRVPALVTPHGVLTETAAILSFIAESHPAAGLAPRDNMFASARLLEFNTYLASTVHVAQAHKARGGRWATEASSIADMARKVPENARACFGLIDTAMLAGPWVLASGYSVADPYLFTLTRWLARDGIDVAEFPRVAAHHERMLARPAVVRVLPFHAS